MRSRSVIAFSLVLAAAGCQTVHLEAPVRARDGDWTMTGATPAHNTRATESIAPPLEEAWSYNAGAAFGSGGVVVIRDVLLVGTRKGELHAVDLETGKRLGIVNFKEPVEGTPVLDVDQLYVATAWGKRTLHAYDLGRGETRWKLESEPVDAAMVLVDGTLVVAEAAGGIAGHDPGTGVTRWRIEPSAGITSSPASVDGRTVIVADELGLVRSVHASDGRIAWQVDLAAPVYAPVVGIGGAVVVPTTRGLVVALDAATGRQRWQVAITDHTVRFGPPAGDDRRVVFGGTDRSVRAVDSRSGSPLWTTTLDDGIVAQPLLAGDIVWVATLGEDLMALSAADGSVLWTTALPGRSRSAMTVHDGGIVVLSEPRTIVYLKPGGGDHAK